MHSLKFLVDGLEREEPLVDLVIAGWTGRNPAAVERHIAELAALGVARPRTVPCFYRAGVNLLTTGPRIDVVGTDSSGEVEFVLVATESGLLLGVGSDHTDRKVEAYDVTVSKQMCPKPIGRELWSVADVANWDALMLRSWITRAGNRELYQHGSVAAMLPPSDLTRRYLGGDQVLKPGTVMYCGTLPVLGTIGGADLFEVELEDPVRKRSLNHSYSVRALPVAN